MSGSVFSRTLNTPSAYSGQPDGRSVLYNQVYLGYVKDTSDSINMGRIKVWIPEFSSNESDSSRWVTVNYCSPFAGATPVSKVKKDDNTSAQQSYGWWATPPDIDNEVIILFINGDPNRGIYIGGLYQQYMNSMVPGIPSTKSYQEGVEGIDPPTLEYNKKMSVPETGEPTRPRYDTLHNGLKNQGLYYDPARGNGDSSAARASPSKVYGILSPGGNHIVIDDAIENSFIRLRTASGVQILVNDSLGVVYINSGSGNSWMEISDDGIDMYSSKSISMRSQGDINMHADGNYNLHVGRANTTFVQGAFTEFSGGKRDILVGRDLSIDVGRTTNLTSEGNIASQTNGAFTVKSRANLTLNTDGTLGFQSAQQIIEKSPKHLINTTTPPAPLVPIKATAIEPQFKSDRELNPDSNYPEIDTLSIVSRLVTHEPFDLHQKTPKPPSRKVLNDDSSRVQVDGSVAPVDETETLPPDESINEETGDIEPSDKPPFIVPTNGTVTSLFGPRNTGISGASTNHKGVDIAAPVGTTVIASKAGKVTRAARGVSGYGTVIYIDHGSGEETRYAHLSSMAVSRGTNVTQGQTIGQVGSTGVGSGPHLHFEIRRNSQAINPSFELPSLKAKGSKAVAGTQGRKNG